MKLLGAILVLLAGVAGACGDDDAPDRRSEPAPIYDTSTLLDPRTVLVQYARNGAGEFETAEARDVARGRLAVRISVSYPTGPDVGIPDNLVIPCVRLVLSEPSTAEEVVGWGGRSPRPIPVDLPLSRDQIRSCPAVDVSLDGS